MNRQCFYTTGCANKTVADLPALVERHDAHIADIRLFVDNTSAAPPGELQRLLGVRYRRVSQLAVRTGKAGDTTVAHLALGLRIILSWHTNVILLCECELLADCHRTIIARELRRQNFAVEELASWRIESPLKTITETLAQEVQISKAQNEASSNTSIELSPIELRPAHSNANAAQKLESGLITLACGSPENVQTKTIEGLIAAGLGIHTDDRDPSLHAITHLASGRRICTAETLNQAKALFNEFLRFGVDWRREVPWQTAGEAQRLKEKISSILRKANKD